MLGSLVQLLVAAFVMGFVAAAPIGPVNMLAIRRGVIGKWTHTLACGSGSAMGDLLIFSLVLLGGSRLDLSRPGVRITLAVAGVVVLIPLSVYFVTRGLRNPLRSFVRSRRRLQGNPPKHLIADAATGALLTIINPAAIFYWITVTSNWLPAARKSELGSFSPWWGLLLTGAGLMSWFLLLTVLVRFTPNRLGPAFFRYVNFACGIILFAFGIYCGGVIFKALWP